MGRQSSHDLKNPGLPDPVYNYGAILLAATLLIAAISLECLLQDDCHEMITIMSWGCANIDLSILQTASVAWSSYHMANQSASPPTGSIINLSWPASVLICHFLFDTPISEEFSISLTFDL